MIRVRIESGQPLARAMIARLLAGNKEIEVLPSPDSPGPDVVIAFSDGEGEWEPILDRAEGAEVILVVDDPSLQDLEEAMRNGIHGVLAMDVGQEELIAALQAVAQGLAIFPSRVTDQAGQLRGSDPSTTGAPESLTAREREVLLLLADGLSNKVIADRLGISDHTVKFHVASILGKLGASSRTEAVTSAIRLGLIMI